MGFFEKHIEYICCRKQGAKTFNFYIKNLKLFCNLTDKENPSTQNISVDIPKNLDLSNENVVENLRDKVLAHSFFSVCKNKVIINPHGLGGFGEDVHYAITKAKAIKVFSQGQNGLMPSNKAIEYIAEIIAIACKEVDAWDIGASPFTKPDWHFNTNETNDDNHDWAIWGTYADTRFVHVIQQCHGYIQERQNIFDKLVRNQSMNPQVDQISNQQLSNMSVYEKKLKNLGYGLHALQDMIAHLPNLVDRDFWISHHLNNLQADDLNYMPARQYYLDRATDLYLQGDLKNLCSLIENARENLRIVAEHNIHNIKNTEQKESTNTKGCGCRI